MDRIYGGAFLTLVAADSSNANSGLLGLRSGSRSLRQIHQQVWPELILTISTPSPVDPAGSVWASRGWTCQEQILSRRLLIFQHGQVFWQCPSCFLCEDIDAMAKVDPPRRLFQLLIQPINVPATSLTDVGSRYPNPLPLVRPRIFSQYSSIVHDYSKRNFTFHNDILFAFEGFGSILQQQFGLRFLAGLPETYLDQALLWMPSVLQQRRADTETQFPSWSWAGWIGQSHYEDTDSSLNFERVAPLIKWHIKDSTDTVAMPINGTGIGINESAMAASRSSNTFLWVPLFDLLSGLTDGCPRMEESTAPQRGITLQCWTSCSFLEMSVKSSPASLDQYEGSKHQPVKLHLYLPDAVGKQLAGYLTLNASEPLQCEVGRHEFIVLSDAQASGFNPVTGTCTYSEAWLMYNVMLIEWDAEHIVASRLGLGRVLKKAWLGSRPKIKWIVLG